MGAAPRNDTPPGGDVGTAAAEVPWGLTGLVLGVLAIAHVGLFLLLTVGARSTLRDAREAFGESELVSAKEPEPAPAVGTPEYRAWNDRSKLWTAARNSAEAMRQRDVLASVLAVSWAAQAGFVIFLMLRTARRRGVRPASARRASPSG